MKNMKFRAYVITDDVGIMIDLSDSRYNQQYFVNGLGRLILVEETDGGCNIHEADSIEDDWSWFRARVIPSTGLKDKKGVEIYEGDILKSRHERNKKYSVVWVRDGFKLEIKFKNKFEGEEFIETAHLPIYSESYEVVGNIFQNPELVEAAE